MSVSMRACTHIKHTYTHNTHPGAPCRRQKSASQATHGAVAPLSSTAACAATAAVAAGSCAPAVAACCETWAWCRRSSRGTGGGAPLVGASFVDAARESDRGQRRHL
eukprot:287113-Pelagomonas_calceolata.AAC.1